MPEHTIPESLVEHIRIGRAALVVGAGFGVPSWKQLLERMNDELRARGDEGDAAAAADVDKLLHKGNFVPATGFLARALGEDACDRIVAETWRTPAELPLVARALARLPFRQVWTTFPGDLLERAMEAELVPGWPLPRVITYRQAGDIDRRRRTLLKILGDFDSYAVTPRSVRKAHSRHPALRDYVHDFYSEGALVLVGFRFGDPDLAALLDRVFTAFEPPQGDHYLVASGLGPVTVDELMFEHHMQVINLAGRGADDAASAATVDFLESLRSACERAGVSLAKIQPEADDLDGWLEVLGEDPFDEEAAQAVLAIERRARDAGDAERLVHVLLARVEIEGAAPERAALLREVAEVYQTQLGDIPRAFTALTAALRVDPADTTSVDEAEKLADDVDGWSELVSDVSEVAGEIEDRALAAGYWVRLGRWYRDKLRHADYATASFREAVKLDPDAPGAYSGLEEVYRVQQRWADLADAIAAHIEREPDPAKTADLYLTLGDLCETQLASTARAVEAYEKAAEVGGDSDDALGALERLYRRDERWGKLAHVLERRAALFEATGESQRAGAARHELATLRADKLGDLEGAIGKYEAAIEADPNDAAALRALEGLYEKVGRTDEYLHTLERLAAVVPEGQRPGLLRRFAAEVEERRGGGDRAAHAYEAVLELEPGADDALRALVRLRRNKGAGAELAALLEEHIGKVGAPAARAELWAELGDVCEQELGDPAPAVAAHRKALAAVKGYVRSLEALARLYRDGEDWERAGAVLIERAEVEPDRAAALWCEAGKLAAGMADDPATAEARLEKALELDPNHLDATLALAELCKTRGKWAGALNRLVEAEAQSQNRLERVRVLCEAAEICERELSDPDRALELRLKVLGIDPEHEDAGKLAAERLLATDRPQTALPILEMLARHVDAADHGERARVHAELGSVCESLGMRDKAAEHYRTATEADPQNQQAALGVASTMFAEAEAGRAAWKDAERAFRGVIVGHGARMSAEEAGEAWYRIAVAAHRRGDAAACGQALDRALEKTPHRAAALELAVEAASARGDWHKVIEGKRAQLDGAPEPVRLKLLQDIAAAYKDHLGDTAAALAALEEAAEIRPNSHVVLHRILDVHTATKKWRRAIDTLAAIATTESDPSRRAKYHYAAAVIARDELSDADAALERFWRALDDDVDTPKAFEAIDRLLTERRDWKNLARAHRKILKRLGEEADPDRLLRLWTRLGEICRDHLRDQEAAIAAFEVAASLSPDDPARHEQLAELYLEAGGARRRDAIEELQTLLAANPDRIEVYRALSKLYRQTHELDKAYCVAQALVFLGAASSGEQALFERHRPERFSLASRRLTEELWQRAVAHRREDRHVSAIFAQVAGALAGTTAQPPGAYRLQPSARVDPQGPDPVGRLFRHVADILALQTPPQVYVDAAGGDGIRVANTADADRLVPSVLVTAPYLGKRSERELAFEVGKRLAYVRPERFVNYALQTLPKLEAAFFAALSASGFPEAAELAEGGGELVEHLKATVPSAILEQVASLARGLEGRLGNGLITAWRTATDLTANRVGFILCDDLETAARAVATESAGASPLPVKERLRDLLAYSVSEEYFAVRRHLGTALEPAEAG